MKDLETRVNAIEERNNRVEQDKAWETSWTRRLTIAAMTYVVVLGYLFAINNDEPFINALVPAVGFVLSTLVLKSIRKAWQK
jgi:hypothetical protein